MALIKDMQETKVIYVGQYKGYKELGPLIPNGKYMSTSFAVSRLFITFIMDNYVEVIIEEEDPGSKMSGVHKSVQINRDSAEITHDIRFVINRCFND